MEKGNAMKPSPADTPRKGKSDSTRITYVSAGNVGLPERQTRSAYVQTRYFDESDKCLDHKMADNKINGGKGRKKKAPKSVKSEGRPVTSSTVNFGEVLSEDGNDALKVSKFRPGRAGFSGTKLKVGRRSYTARPIIPADKPELVSVAEAMHREKFGERLKTIFAPETEAAIKALESGVYVGWRCAEYTWDCIRVGESSLCFCGHTLSEHRQYNGPKSQVPCAKHDCRCRAFAFVPSRPEDVGEFWLQRRPGYDANTWKAKCRCKHTHTDHTPTGIHPCTFRGCRCGQFVSSFLCAACDKHWEDHETYFDTEKTRVEKGLPHGEAYIPFADIPRLRNMALTGKGNDNSSYKALTHSCDKSSTLKSTQVDNNTPVPFGYYKTKKSPFDPVYD